MPGEAVLESVRRSVSRWPLWELPRWLQALVTGVVAVYCAAACAAVALTRVQAGQLEFFAVLVLCSATTIELTRRTGEPIGLDRDVSAVWDLPAAVLLPPVYALLVPIPRIALTQVRVRRGAVHRRAYTAAALGLAYAAASLAFHAAVPGLGPGAGTGTGRHALLWALLVAGCGLLKLVLNDGLVITAVKGSDPGTRLLREAAGPEAVFGSVAELLLGTLAAFAAAHATLNSPRSASAPSTTRQSGLRRAAPQSCCSRRSSTRPGFFSPWRPRQGQDSASAWTTRRLTPNGCTGGRARRRRLDATLRGTLCPAGGLAGSQELEAEAGDAR